MQRSELTENAAAQLCRYDFPGNVRELDHLMDRCSIVAEGRAITAEQVEAELSVSGQNFERLEDLLYPPVHESVVQWEMRLITKVMAEAEGNEAEAARRLGIY